MDKTLFEEDDGTHDSTEEIKINDYLIWDIPTDDMPELVTWLNEHGKPRE